MDAPLILNYGFAHSERSILEIDPKGQSVDLDIPAVGDFARRGEKNFAIEWPTATSGLLLVEGFQPASGEPDGKNLNPRSLVILIDSLDGSLTDLNKTLKALKNTSSGSHTTIHLTNVVPPADNIDLAFKALLTLHSPLELGATLDNQRLKEMIVAEPAMLRKYSERGGSLRHLTLSRKDRSCPDKCSTRQVAGDEFSSTFAIRRSEEIASTSDVIRNDEFMTDNGALFVETDFPAEYFRLNWTTAFEPGESLHRWLFGGFREIMGGRDLALRKREKLVQMDAWLAKIISSFFVTSGNANIAIFLHQNNTPIKLGSNPDSEKSLVRGEALFSVNNFTIENAQKDEVQSIGDATFWQITCLLEFTIVFLSRLAFKTNFE
ncbi:hypothetical protein EBR21_17480, partial [bacterium]|nr:hypothetical protein [bacterium]